MEKYTQTELDTINRNCRLYLKIGALVDRIVAREGLSAKATRALKVKLLIDLAETYQGGAA